LVAVVSGALHQFVRARLVGLLRSTTIVKTRLLRIAGWLPRDDWLVIGWALAIKALLFALGAASYQAFEEEDVPFGRPWLEIWNLWDAIHFLRLAEFGYSAADKFKAWFYPFYPWCVRAFAYVSGDFLIASFLVSGIALLFAVVVLRRLTAIEWNATIARRTVYFFLIFPTAYVLHIGYTESLFFALTVGSIFAARTERWWLAGVLGAFAWMTRANGVVLLPTLAVEAGHQWATIRRWRWQWLWIAVVPAGFAVYLFLNWRISGDPFAFLKLRRQLFHMSFSWPWNGIPDAFLNVRRVPNEGEIVGTQEALFTVLGFVCAVASWFKLRPLYATWLTGNWLLLVCVTFVESMPRYSLTMFPIFFLFAFVTENRFWNAVITIWSLLSLALFSGLFVRGWWVS
jgi:Mannosyltransferase (PIG-V)